jgi:hypothetical protein
VLVIDVATPLRADDRYLFECRIRRQRPLRRRLMRPSIGGSLPRGMPDVVRFGFRTTGWRLEHHPVWDAIYPLMYLTRNGGPLFGRGLRGVRIRMGYPIPPQVRDFYVQRAHDLGIEVTIEARPTSACLDGTTRRDVIAFGGGKESRVLLGMLREVGRDPVIVSSWARSVPDLPEALVSDPSTVELTDRIIPALMQRGARLYLGGTVGGAQRTTPWHRYFDVSSPAAMRETSAMLASVGLPTRMTVPLAIAPPNIGQWVLHDRYPDLFSHQRSTRDGQQTEKNLHVALCRYHHGIPFEQQCPPELFARLLDRFVTRELARPGAFGARGEREVISREMRAIIHRHRADEAFAPVRDRIPDDWAGDWIDVLHTYVDPDADPALLDILRGYAPPIDEAPEGARLWRVPI